MHKLYSKFSVGKARLFVLAAVLVVAVAVPASSALATEPEGVTLDSSGISTPLGEYVGLIGAVLVGIVIAAFGGMAIVALAKAAFREAKSLIGRIA